MEATCRGLLPLVFTSAIALWVSAPTAHAESCSANPYQKYVDIPFPDSCNENVDDRPMRFRIRDPNPLLPNSTEIVAVGAVEADTATQFVKFLDANQGKFRHVVTVTLNSLGGNLDPGLAMGLIIRQRGFLTSIMPNEAPAGAPFTQACGSSCNFIFMGGVRRTLPPGALFITHRFSPKFEKLPDPKGPIMGNDLADLAAYFEQDGEATMGEVAKFLRIVGVDQRFLEEMATIPNESRKILSPDQLQQLNITTTFTTTDWRIRTGNLLRGFQLDGITGKPNRPNLVDQVSIVCQDKRLGVVVNYVPDPSDTRMAPSFWDSTVASLNRRLTAVAISAGASRDRFPRAQVAILGQLIPDHLAVSLPFTAMMEQALRREPFIDVSFEVNDEVQVNSPVQSDYTAADHKVTFTTDLRSGREIITGFLDNCR